MMRILILFSYKYLQTFSIGGNRSGSYVGDVQPPACLNELVGVGSFMLAHSCLEKIPIMTKDSSQ